MEDVGDRNIALSLDNSRSPGEVEGRANNGLPDSSFNGLKTVQPCWSPVKSTLPVVFNLSSANFEVAMKRL